MVRDQLTKVDKVQASYSALPTSCTMALLCLSWVQERLTRVPHKHKQQGFAGIKDDGTVVTWGHVETGGDSSHECVRQGFRSNPILCDGTIVTWGNGDVGGVHDEDQDELDMLYHICARFTHTHTHMRTPTVLQIRAVSHLGTAVILHGSRSSCMPRVFEVPGFG